jgi:hypothetical protein
MAEDTECSNYRSTLYYRGPRSPTLRVSSYGIRDSTGNESRITYANAADIDMGNCLILGHSRCTGHLELNVSTNTTVIPVSKCSGRSPYYDNCGKAREKLIKCYQGGSEYMYKTEAKRSSLGKKWQIRKGLCGMDPEGSIRMAIVPSAILPINNIGIPRYVLRSDDVPLHAGR